MSSTWFFSLWVLFATGACVTTPAPQTSPPAPVSEADEIQMGRDADRNLIAVHRFYDDSALERYVNQVGLRVAARCERPDLPWTFRVVDDPSVNALALPGGFVYVTRGMLAYLNSEAQLAAVLGHEIGHVAVRHTVRRNTRLGMTSQGRVVATTGGSVIPVYGSVDRLQALLRAHSRQAEQEADDLGLRYMSAAGYDPREMLAVLRTIERAGAGGSQTAWLATHPSPERRIDDLNRERSNLKNAGTLIEHEAYLAHVDGLAFGPDRRKGYFEKRRFVVPAQAYQVTFPDGWTVSTDGAIVRGKNSAQDAAVDIAVMDQPSADSAARFFFAKVALPRGSLTYDPVNGLTAVSASFSGLPLSVKISGSVTFVENRGRVYRVMGYTRDHGWSANQAAVEGVLRTFTPLPDDELQQARPLRVMTVSLTAPTSLAALARVRPAPVELTDLAAMNQVSSDSLLPAGQFVKWVTGLVQR